MANCKVVLRAVVQLGSIYHVSNGCSLHFFFFFAAVHQSVEAVPWHDGHPPPPPPAFSEIRVYFFEESKLSNAPGLGQTSCPPPPPLKKWPVEVVQEYFIFFVFRLTFNETKASSVLARSHFS